MYDELCDYKEVARILRVTPRTVKDWCAKGRFPEPAIRDGRFVRFLRRSQVQAWIDGKSGTTEGGEGNVEKTA